MTEQTHLSAPSEVQPVAVPENQTATPTDPYADVTLAETSCIEAESLAAFKQTAATLNLPAEALQKWLSLEEGRLQGLQKQQEEQKRAQTAAWARQTQEELGPSWQEKVSQAVRAADAFGGPELRQLLEETGLGNHPVIVRTFIGIGKRMSEDITAAGTSGAQTDKTFSQALYGKN